MSRRYIVYIGICSQEKIDLKSIINFDEDHTTMELAGMIWTVEIDTDQEGFFKKDEFDEQYDFDAYLLSHVFINDSIDKVVSIILMDQNLEYTSVVAKKELIEKELIEKIMCLQTPFAVRYCSNEEFIYPSHLIIAN